MPLIPGQPLLHYRIVEKLGEGGMGAVWKAVDTTLDREVAIKVLPEAFARDAERLARFQREARMLAALSHPGIAAVHSVHEAEGIRFLAMELVPGVDLEERLGRGPLPLDEALDVARQLAEALEAAHERGVIHRDLKPANVKLTPDGRVKVLDLGLAKALDAPEAAGRSEAGLSRSPTMTSGGTLAGMILGTAAYMSPEQAKGAPVDRRADVWAFGVVLHEMLTGRRLFPGDTPSEVIAAVLRADIELDDLPPATPASVRRLLRRCLQRDPKRRLRDLGDARLELDPAESEVESGAGGAAALDAGAGGLRLSRATLGLAAAIIVALGLAVAWLATRERPAAPGAVTRFALYDIGMPIDAFQGVALSPDGRRIVFRARGSEGGERLHVRDLGDYQVRPLPGTELGWLPFFSPDGSQVGFFALGKLKTINLDGGLARTVTELPSGFAGAVWLPDDSIIFTSNASERLGRVPAAGGEIAFTQIDTGKGGGVVTSPWLLPGGDALLLNVGSVGTGGSFDVAVYDLDDGSLSIVAENGFTPSYATSGHIIYQQGEAGPLMALPFDAASRRVTGEAFPVLDDVGSRVSYQVRMFTLSETGTLAYIPRSPLLDSGAVVWVDRKGETTPIVEIGKILVEPRLSPDGGRIAFRTPAPTCDLWVHDIARGTTTRITHEGDNHGLAWSPDGRRVAFCRLGSPEWAVLSVSADGAGEVEQLSPPQVRRGYAASMSPDGAFVLVEARGEATGADVDLVDVKEKTVRSLFGTRFEEAGPAFSPDGRHIAYVSDESGRREVYVVPFPALDARVQISTSGGMQPVWSPRGDELFFRSDRAMLVVDVDLAPELTAGRPRPLFESEHSSSDATGLPGYDVSPDGQRFVMVRERAGAAGAEIHIVLDWLQELRPRAAVP